MAVKVQKLVESFNEIVGWPYKTPGTNDQNGIDCSGAFVRAFRLQGAGIYHGSNTIYRHHCRQVGTINSVALMPGMAVFKCRIDNNEPAKFRGDGVGNMYHIGLITGVNPLRIVHATVPVAKMDTAIGQWSHYGLLSAVDYEDGIVTETEEMALGMVTAETGKVVRMRKEPSTTCKTYWNVPVGSIVGIIDNNPPGWKRIEYNGREAFMMDAFLIFNEDQAEEDILPEPPKEQPAIFKERYGKVAAPIGNLVKMRDKPTQLCKLYWYVPVGTTVRVFSEEAGWCKIVHLGRTGYMLKEFIVPQ